MTAIQQCALGFLCLMVLSLPVDALVSPGGVSLVKVAGIMSFACVMLLAVAGAELRGAGWFVLACLLYLSWVIISFLWTAMPVDYTHTHAINSWQSVKASLYLFGLVLLLFQVVRSERDLQAVFGAFLLGCTWLMLLFLSSYQPGVRTVRHEVEGLDANEMTVIICLGVPLAIYLMACSRSVLIRLMALAYLPLTLFAVLVTGSRTGIIVLLTALTGLLPLWLKAALLIRMLSLVILLTASAWALDKVPEKTLERLLATGSELSRGTLSERSITWTNAYQEWQKQPVFGYGLGAFRRQMSQYNVEYTAHNSYISIAFEHGLIGLLLYLGVILSAFVHCLSLAGAVRGYLLPILGVAILGQMTLTLHETMFIWFAYMTGVLMARLQLDQAHAATLSAIKTQRQEAGRN